MRQFRIYVASLLLLVCAAVGAENYVGVSAAVMYPWQTDKLSSTSADLGVGGNIGVLYQYRYQHFILNIGLEGQYAQRGLKMEGTTLQYQMIDTQGKDFLYRGQLDNRRDISRSLSAQIPVLLGAEFGKFYFLAGAKVNFHVSGTAEVKARLATSGVYDRYYDVLENMPNHGFHSYENVSSSGPISYKTDVLGAVEVGMTFKSKKKTVYYRLGVYGEYGLLDIWKSRNDGGLVEADLSQYMNVEMHHVYAAELLSSPKVHNAAVGLKFTTLFGIAGAEKCLCDRYKPF